MDEFVRLPSASNDHPQASLTTTTITTSIDVADMVLWDTSETHAFVYVSIINILLLYRIA